MFYLDTKKKKGILIIIFSKKKIHAKNRDVSYRKKFTGDNLIGLVCKCMCEGKGGGIVARSPSGNRVVLLTAACYFWFGYCLNVAGLQHFSVMSGWSKRFLALLFVA